MSAEMKKPHGLLPKIGMICVVASVLGCGEQAAPESVVSPAPLASPTSARCAGSYEVRKCEEQEARLAAETPEQARERALRLDAERQAAAAVVAASPGPSPHEAARELVTLSGLRRLSETGMKTYEPHQLVTSINGYDTAGGDRLCDVVRYDGYCDPGRDSVRVLLDLASSEQRRQLYDTRGRRGAKICGTVEMRPDGNLYLVDFTTGGSCG